MPRDLVLHTKQEERLALIYELDELVEALEHEEKFVGVHNFVWSFAYGLLDPEYVQERKSHMIPHNFCGSIGCGMGLSYLMLNGPNPNNLGHIDVGVVFTDRYQGVLGFGFIQNFLETNNGYHYDKYSSVTPGDVANALASRLNELLLE